MSIELSELSINGLYSIREQAKVLDFLERHSALVPILKEGYYEIKKYFPEARLTLSLLVDPEAENTQLVIWINTDMIIDEAVSKLYAVDEEWTHKLPENISSNLIISLGLQDAR